MLSDATLTEAPPPREEPGAEDLGGSLSRRGMLRLSTSMGAAAALGAGLAACGKKTKTGPPAQQPSPNPVNRFGQGDAGVMKYLLTIDLLQLDLYRSALRRANLRGRARGLFQRFEQHELEHVDLLRGLVNQMAGDAPRDPKGVFAIGSAEEVVRFTARFEALGAAAYLAQVGNLQDESLLETLLTIHSVEARQAAALSELAGGPPSPDGAFGKPRTQVEVARRIDPLLEGG
jgi:hypothetical protein